MLKHVSTPLSSLYASLPKSSSTTSSNNHVIPCSSSIFDIDRKRQSSSSTTSSSSSDSISLNSSDCSMSINGSNSGLVINDSIESNSSPVNDHHHHQINKNTINLTTVPIGNDHHQFNDNQFKHDRSWSSSSSSSLPSLMNDNNESNNIISTSNTLTKVKNNDRKIVIKIYTRVLCTDIEYKTLSITNRTTSKEIVKIILNKFRMHDRDSNLFYLTLEAWIKQTAGIPIRSVMTLDDDTYPALLQSCYHRQNDLKFTLVMRRGENVRVYNRIKDDGPPIINVLISEKTNCKELIELILNTLGLKSYDHRDYDIYVYSPSCQIEQKLLPNDRPLAIRMEWPNQDFNRFEIRKNFNLQIHSDSRSIMQDFRRNFKSELTMNLMGAAATTLPVTTGNQLLTNHNNNFDQNYRNHYHSHPQLSTTTLKTLTNGKVLYI